MKQLAICQACGSGNSVKAATIDEETLQRENLCIGCVCWYTAIALLHDLKHGIVAIVPLPRIEDRPQVLVYNGRKVEPVN